MNNLNSIILEGNLVRDASLAEPVPGFKKCIFSVGVNRFYKNKKNEAVDEVSFFDIETYGRMAEYCSEKAKKGRGVRVVGRLKQDSWKDDSGKTQSRVYVVAEHIEYKPEKKSEEAAKQAEVQVTTPPEQAAEQEKEAVAVEETAVF
jgi:single-strand DNA-binding protein